MFNISCPQSFGHIMYSSSVVLTIYSRGEKNEPCEHPLTLQAKFFTLQRICFDAPVPIEDHLLFTPLTKLVSDQSR